MMDYLDSLKDIKKELMKEQGQKIIPNNKDDSKEFESLAAKEKRLQAEFVEFIKNADIKR